MRWIWIDRVVDFQPGRCATAEKNVTLSEEHLHDHFPGFPIMPECLMIEAMAQTGGILVGQAKDFREKVVLAKIQKAVFFDYVRPGDTIHIHATIDSIAAEAASTKGRITRQDEVVAEIDLMFSHIDQNLAGVRFPKENFVFETGVFKSLIRELAQFTQGAKQGAQVAHG